MKTFKQLVSEIYDYPPTTAGEKKFIDIHKTSVMDYPVKNDHGLPFRDDRIKPPGPHQNKPASYDPPKEPTQVYKKTNEDIDLTELLGIDASQISEDGLFESNDMLSLLAVVADTDTTSEIFFEESEEGLVIDKEIAELLLHVYSELDEEDQAAFEAALTESNESFDRVVDLCIEALEEEDVNEEKHVFHVHMPADDIRGHKMVDDKTSEPVGAKPKGTRLKITVPGSSRNEATNKAAKYVAKNYGTNVKFTYAGKVTEELNDEHN